MFLCKTLLLQLISYLCGHLFIQRHEARPSADINDSSSLFFFTTGRRSTEISSQLVGGSQPFVVIFLPQFSDLIAFLRHLCFRDISFFLLTTQIAPGRVSCHDSLLLRLLLPLFPDNNRNRGPKQTGKKKPNYSLGSLSLSKVEKNVNYHSWIQNQIELLIS